jgi:hypothetical protein
MIGIGNNLEVRGLDLIEVLSNNFPSGSEENNENSQK